MAIRQELTQNQLNAVPHVVAARSQAEAAQRAGVSEKSIQRWMADEVFKKAVLDAQTKLADLAFGRLASNTSRAVDTLAELLDSDSDNVRRMAANDMIRSSIQLKRLGDLEQRIQQLERLAGVE